MSAGLAVPLGSSRASCSTRANGHRASARDRLSGARLQLSARDRAAEDLAGPPTVYLLGGIVARRCFRTSRPPISTRAAGWRCGRRSVPWWVAPAGATIPLVIFMFDHSEMLGDQGLTAKG